MAAIRLAAAGVRQAPMVTVIKALMHRGIVEGTAARVMPALAAAAGLLRLAAMVRSGVPSAQVAVAVAGKHRMAVLRDCTAPPEEGEELPVAEQPRGGECQITCVRAIHGGLIVIGL